MEAAQIAKKAARIKTAAPSAHVAIIGCWIWTTFRSKPDPDVRKVLKAEGFRWNQKRQCWQFAGKRTGGSRNGRPWIEAKYGRIDVDDQF